MENLKSQIISIFNTRITNLKLDQNNLNKELLELKLNSIIEEIIDRVEIKQTISIPLSQTSNNNINISIDSGKLDDVNIKNDFVNNTIVPTKQKETTTIPDDFELSYDMAQFAKSKFIQNPEDVFEDFKYYYQSKGILNNDWVSVWKRWVLKQNKYKSHLIKTVIDEDMELTPSMIDFAKKYIDPDNIEIEFTKFKNHYSASGDIKASWEKMWENWAIKYKQFKPKHNSRQEQKNNYRWDFKKAKEVSDRIKDWLEFEKGIDWLNEFYLKDIPIPGIGWQEVQHPDFNKEEILLYKINSENGEFMLQHKSDDIIDAEVLEND